MSKHKDDPFGITGADFLVVCDEIAQSLEEFNLPLDDQMRKLVVANVVIKTLLHERVQQAGIRITPAPNGPDQLPVKQFEEYLKK